MPNSSYNSEQTQHALGQAQGWSLNGKGEIEKRFEFENFGQALAFVNKVGTVAEEMEHHPDIFISYNKVTLNLTTHDAGGLTTKDFDLATRANQIAA